MSNLVSKVIIVELLKNRISRKENKKYEIKRRKAFLVFLGHLPFTALTFMFFIFTLLGVIYLLSGGMMEV